MLQVLTSREKLNLRHNVNTSGRKDENDPKHNFLLRYQKAFAEQTCLTYIKMSRDTVPVAEAFSSLQ